MAGTTVLAKETGMPGSDVKEVRLAFNEAVDDLDALKTKVNAIITAAATSLAAIAAVPAASAIVANKVANQYNQTT